MGEDCPIGVSSQLPQPSEREEHDARDDGQRMTARKLPHSGSGQHPLDRKFFSPKCLSQEIFPATPSWESFVRHFFLIKYLPRGLLGFIRKIPATNVTSQTHAL